MAMPDNRQAGGVGSRFFGGSAMHHYFAGLRVKNLHLFKCTMFSTPLAMWPCRRRLGTATHHVFAGLRVSAGCSHEPGDLEAGHLPPKGGVPLLQHQVVGLIVVIPCAQCWRSVPQSTVDCSGLRGQSPGIGKVPLGRTAPMR